VATVITISRPELVALIETAAKYLTDGDTTEVVALAVRHLLARRTPSSTLFGAHEGSVRTAEGADLIAPSLDVVPDAEAGREIER